MSINTDDEECPEFLYKYMSATVALKVLRSRRFWWSTRSLFNDPFDLGWDFEGETTYTMVRNAFIEETLKITFDANIALDSLSDSVQPYIAEMRNTAKTRSRDDVIKLVHDDAPSRGIDVTRGPLMADENRRKMWAEFADSMRIFCVAEEPDNILMWSHYADKHTGIVIGLRTSGSANRPFRKVMKVRYETKVPQVLSVDDWVQHTFYKKTVFTWDLAQTILATKSTVWRYEKEWRMVVRSGHGDGAPKPEVEEVEFRHDEIASVFIGCRTSKPHTEALLDLVKHQWRVFQFTQPKTKFVLESKRIV